MEAKTLKKKIRTLQKYKNLALQLEKKGKYGMVVRLFDWAAQYSAELTEPFKLML